MISLALLAQIAAPATNAWSADLTNALNLVLMASATAAAGIITAVGIKLAKKFGVEATATEKANLEADITTALNVGITQVLPVIEKNGWDSPQAHDAIIATASDYLKQRFPDRAASIVAAAQPASAADPKVSSPAAINETLSARLPDAIATAAASPATPPTP